jgi:hypothetical protein
MNGQLPIRQATAATAALVLITACAALPPQFDPRAEEPTAEAPERMPEERRAERRARAEARAERLARETALRRESLRLQVQTPAEVAVGDTIPVRLILSNVADEPVPVHPGGFGGHPGEVVIVRDIYVVRPGTGRVRDLHGAVPPPAARAFLVMEPRSKVEIESRWDQRDDHGRSVPPGTYLIYGRIHPEGMVLWSDTAWVRIRTPDR